MTGTLTDIESLRHTPAGLPRRRLWLAHRSRQVEAGEPREVQARIAVVLIGEEMVRKISRLEAGDRIRVAGFLARASYRGVSRDRLQLHADMLESLD